MAEDKDKEKKTVRLWTLHRTDPLADVIGGVVDALRREWPGAQIITDGHARLDETQQDIEKLLGMIAQPGEDFTVSRNGEVFMVKLLQTPQVVEPPPTAGLTGDAEFGG